MTRPSFPVLQETLFGGRSAYVPLFELIVDRSIKAAFLGHPVESVEDEIAFAQSAGYDYVLFSPRLDFAPELAGEDRSAHLRDRADLSGSRVWAEEGKGIFSSARDVEAFPWPSVDDLDWGRLNELEHRLPPEMGIIGQYGDIFTWSWRFLGFERFSFALVEEPALVEAVFERIGTLEYQMFQRMAASPRVGALFYSDDIAYRTGLMVSPEVLRRFLFPWIRRIAELAESRRIPLIYHSDGDLRLILDELLELGVRALHPIEPKAMDIVELKRRYGNRLCLCGNVDVDLLARGSPEEIRRQVAWLINSVGRHGGYCLGSGNSVPEYVPLENYRAMIETALELGVL
ncbi:MAG: nucleoside 2-deoxyribosyltransferase [candidate division KSB1 bacterium]|nr:nucleoside 2-deoxyribosyltransferase [candidate division KSB1 bacterium]